MENDSPQSDTAFARKLRLSKGRSVDKSDVLKALPVSSMNANPKLTECRHGIRQEAFSASFVD